RKKERRIVYPLTEVISQPIPTISKKKEFDMEFTYTVTKNGKLIAGFTNYVDACTYKDILVNISRMAGCNDKFKIEVHSE
uniref:hypothetical protein n=1 Tax=Bacteroides acidifaciens TaxID=85831 RepID=UPI00242AE0A2